MIGRAKRSACPLRIESTTAASATSIQPVKLVRAMKARSRGPRAPRICQSVLSAHGIASRIGRSRTSFPITPLFLFRDGLFFNLQLLPPIPPVKPDVAGEHSDPEHHADRILHLQVSRR